jgi:1,4-dihydroxy-2-naphthoate octaprenyltransferase
MARTALGVVEGANTITMRAILLHLRFPFSFFLLPVFLFASVFHYSPLYSKEWWLLLAILHFLVYPASNAYNSYMDQDEGSIGGLEYPPEATKGLFWTANFMDVVAGLLAVLFLGNATATVLIIYILISRAYSYRGIRLKQYPVIGFISVALLQGTGVYAMVGFLGGSIGDTGQWITGGFLSFLMIGAGYPLTQIYQHQADEKDGVMTLSRLLGIKGTFIFSSICFALLGIGWLWYFKVYLVNFWMGSCIMVIALTPVFIYFANWIKVAWNDPQEASFKRTMKMNHISSWCSNIGLTLLFFMENEGFLWGIH